MTIEFRIRLLKIFLGVMSLFLLFWWPLSHWFYSDWYHGLLGFEPGSYQESMVKMIGTCGIFPVMISINAFFDPIKNRGDVVCMITGSLALGVTFVHLILEGSFPVNEIVNVVMCFSTAVFLIIIYPWKLEKIKS